jgi:hypothetical protein
VQKSDKNGLKHGFLFYLGDIRHTFTIDIPKSPITEVPTALQSEISKVFKQWMTPLNE